MATSILKAVNSGYYSYAPSDVSVASGTTWKNITSITLPTAGTYLVFVHCTYAKNATGYRCLAIANSPTEGGFGYYANDRRRAVDGDATTCLVAYIIPVDGPTTFYINGSQNSGSALTVTTRCRWLRLY